MLEGVVVVEEGLLGVEGGVEVGEFDFADVCAGELGELDEAGEGVEGVAADEEVVGGALGVRGGIADRAGVVEEADFGDAVVGGGGSIRRRRRRGRGGGGACWSR